MSSIRATRLAMGHTFNAPQSAPRCSSCPRASWQTDHHQKPERSGWWCAEGQFWTRLDATCERHPKTRP